MKKIIPLILSVLLLGWICSNRTCSTVNQETKMTDSDTTEIDTKYYSYGELSLCDIVNMDSIEKRRFYLALTDSLPDLWVVRDIDETSYVGEDSIPSLPENDIIHLIYRQKVNGYHVKIEFDRKYDVMRGQEGYSVYTGHAILSFSKPGHAFQVYCEDFSDEQLKVWDLTNDEYYKKDKNSIDLSIIKAGETVYLDYICPKKWEYLSHSSPFYFKDMDFDGEEELVVNNLSMGSRGYNTYDVFKVYHVERPLRLMGLPFTDGLYKITDYNVEYEAKTQCVMDKRYDGFDAYGYYIYKSVPSSKNNGLRRVFILVDAEDMGFYHLKDKKASDSINLIQPFKKYERINGCLKLVERGVYESGNYGRNYNEVILEKLKGE